MSLSFLVDTMDKRRGGCAPNIAYTLALLGERPYLMATAGQDFGDYRAWLDAAGVDTSLVKQVDGQVHGLVLLQHRSAQQPDRLVLYRRDGQRRRAVVPHRRAGKLAIVSPNDPAAMGQYAEECRVLGIPFIYDFGQQVARVSGDELLEGLTGAAVVISNDYEFQCPCRRPASTRPGSWPGEDAGRHAGRARLQGRAAGGHDLVPAVTPARIVDPTGVGDAFRGGLMKGLAAGAEWATCARLGSVAAAYALEHLGGTSHAYTLDEFRARYEQHFGPLVLPAPAAV